MVKCIICGKNFKNYRALRCHIARSHKISIKLYYDKYLKKENEEICLMYGKVESCKKYTKFDGLTTGYRLHCNNPKCSTLDPVIQKKIRNTWIRKYGKDNPSKVLSIKEKKEKTCFKNHGVKYPAKSSDLKNKMHLTRMKSFLVALKEFLQNINLELVDSEYIHAHHLHRWKCLKCDTIFKQRWNNIQQGYKCPKCYPRNQGYSQAEIEIGDWIESLGFEIIRNSRSIIGKELDIYIPELKIGVEYNGLYWHQESEDITKNYHLTKTELCAKKDTQLIHIFEDEWLDHKEDIKKLLYKILVENYDLLDNKCQSVVINRRFSKNPEYYEKLSYIVKISGPRLYPNDRRYTVWDTGYLELTKKIGD